MEFLILGILIILFFPLCGYLVPIIKRSTANIWKISFALSAILTLLTLFTLNQKRLVLAEQTEVIEWVRHLRGHEDKESLSAVRDNFVFIDNSFSNQLLPLPGGNQLGNSTVRVTDRRELSRILQILQHSDSLIDAIVCDIYMDIPSDADSMLRDVLTNPVIESKILLSSNFLNPNTEMFASLNDSIYGNIVEKKAHNLFATYRPYWNNIPSLSYKLYAKLQSLRTRQILGGLLIKESPNKGWPRFGLNAYIPSFRFTDEKLLYQGFSEVSEGYSLASDHNYFELGDVTTLFGGNNLIRTLSQRKKESKRNIIFIGSFKGAGMDMHSTMYGNLHGATILLNLFYSHLQGQHRISVFYVLYLWLGIALILFILIKRSAGLPVFINNTSSPKRLKKASNPVLRKIRESLNAMYSILIVEEIHFWFLAAFTFITAIIWDKTINGLGLFILMFIIFKVLQYYSHHNRGH